MTSCELCEIKARAVPPITKIQCLNDRIKKLQLQPCHWFKRKPCLGNLKNMYITLVETFDNL